MITINEEHIIQINIIVQNVLNKGICESVHIKRKKLKKKCRMKKNENWKSPIWNSVPGEKGIQGQQIWHPGIIHTYQKASDLPPPLLNQGIQ